MILGLRVQGPRNDSGVYVGPQGVFKIASVSHPAARDLSVVVKP